MKMRRMIPAMFLLAAAATAAWAGPREDAMQVVGEWAKAFTASDVDGIAALYAPDALFIGTAGKAVIDQPGEVRAYFERALKNRQRTAHLDSSSVLVVSDSAVAVSGFDTLTDVHDGKSVASHGRVTFVVAKRGGDWKIVQFHRSPMPK